MIIGWIRLAFFLLIGSSIAYVALLIYFRSTRREALEDRWREASMQGDRDAWIEAGMQAYGKSLKLRLLWLIYIVPMVVCSTIFIYTNWGRL